MATVSGSRFPVQGQSRIAANRKPETENPCSCGKPSVYFRPYEGRQYCSSCFCKSIERRVRKTISKYQLLKSGDKIAIGFSGGKDSSVLLHLLAKTAAKRHDIDIFAVSVDEGIKGYRDNSLPIAKRLSKKLGVKHVIRSYKQEFGKTLDAKLTVLEKHGTPKTVSCTYCGVARRYLLNKAARDLGATKLAVGHNLDDEAQAILMNWIRGDVARASRLGTVSDSRNEGFIPRIKPLRFIPEREIALYARLVGLDIHNEECPYATGVRFEVRDFVNSLEAKYPGTKFAIVESFERIKPLLASLSGLQSPVVLCSQCKEPSSQQICKACELWRAPKTGNREQKTSFI